MMLALPAIANQTNTSLPLILLDLKGEDQTDDSIYNRVIPTDMNLPSLVSGGKYGSYSFDLLGGLSEVEIKRVVNTSLNSKMSNKTLEFWAISDAFNSNGYSLNSIGLLSYGGLDISMNYRGAAAGSPLGTTSIRVYNVTEGSVLLTAPFSWTHYAFYFYSGTLPKFGLWENGIFIGDFTIDSPSLIVWEAAPVFIGVTKNNTTNFAFNGKIDTVRITKGRKYNGNFDPETDTGLAPPPPPEVTLLSENDLELLSENNVTLIGE